MTRDPSVNMPDSSAPRVALLGFSIECNKFAPVATNAHFLARTYLEGDAIVEDARSATPRMLPETPGFIAAMDASGTWTPVGGRPCPVGSVKTTSRICAPEGLAKPWN